MLTVKVFVNSEQVDELYIYRLDPIEEGKDMYAYRVEWPPAVKLILRHTRSRGWVPLVRSALRLLEVHPKWQNRCKELSASGWVNLSMDTKSGSRDKKN